MQEGPTNKRAPKREGERPTVLLVEDDADLADLYAEWIEESYTVQVAHDGARALEMLDEQVDIVLLDRRMPNLSGDEALIEIRERGIDCRVAMVSAVAPDFNVLEMGFDHYLTKPVSKNDLSELIDDLLARASYHEQVQRYYSLAARCAALESEKTEAALEGSDRYAELQAELADLRDQVNKEMADMTTQDFKVRFRELGDRADTVGGESP